MGIVVLTMGGAVAGAAVIGLLVAFSLARGLVSVASKDVTGVFTLIKGTGFLLLGPTLWYIFPSWPQWIAKLFPTYWVIDPVYEVTINGAGLGDIWGELLIGLGVIMLLVVPLVWLTRRLETKLALAA